MRHRAYISIYLHDLLYEHHDLLTEYARYKALLINMPQNPNTLLSLRNYTILAPAVASAASIATTRVSKLSKTE